MIRSIRNCLTVSLLALLSCTGDDPAQPSGEQTLLTVGVPMVDTVLQGARRKYAVAVAADSIYVVRMSTLSGKIDLKVFGEDTTFSQNWYCMIDMTGAAITEHEYCIILASSTRMYMAVEGSRLESPSAAYTVDVQALPLIDLPLSTPLPGEAPRGGVVVFVTNVVPGNKYVTGTTILSDRAALMGTWGNSGGYSIGGGFGGPFDLVVETTGTKLYLAIDATSITSPALQVVAVTTPSAVMATPVVGTSGAVPVGVPTIGFVEPEGESFYYTEGMTPGEHLISLLGLTNIAYLRVFADPLYTIENDCTALTPNEQECKVTGTSAYFSVRAAPLNHAGGETGAGYVMLVR